MTGDDVHDGEVFKELLREGRGFGKKIEKCYGYRAYHQHKYNR